MDGMIFAICEGCPLHLVLELFFKIHVEGDVKSKLSSLNSFTWMEEKREEAVCLFTFRDKLELSREGDACIVHQRKAPTQLSAASTVSKQGPNSLYLVNLLALGVLDHSAWVILRLNIIDLHPASEFRKAWDGRQSRQSSSTDGCCSFFVKSCCYPLQSISLINSGTKSSVLAQSINIQGVFGPCYKYENEMKIYTGTV